MTTGRGRGVRGQQRGREAEQEGEVPCHPLAGISLDGPVPEDQRQREHCLTASSAQGRPPERPSGGYWGSKWTAFDLRVTSQQGLQFGRNCREHARPVPRSILTK